MRTNLKTGTIIRVPGGILYEIMGEPIGEGGGSIIYPVQKFLPNENRTYSKSSILYALKECFPVSSQYTFFRNDSGEIAPVQTENNSKQYLSRAKEMLISENTITGDIYHTGFRLTPVLESFQEIEISQNQGLTFQKVANSISIMESLYEKGLSLKTYLKEKNHLPAEQTFRIIEQILYAVREVHEAGYLHLDLQDGNIFLKGMLEDGSGMISLIDFGSSRKRMGDGLCAAIEDCVLYSTPGFSAPEMLSGNDGTLRLGPEADIYSIGCLTLYLLTGHKFSCKELSSNKTGRYIPRFSIRKTRCPKHLVEQMQGIVAKALARYPEDRYADTQDMLKDVTAFLAMLAPYISPLSAVKYDAFICYRHGVLDTPAARELRNSLERFKGGHFLGPKPVKKVFLDEGELSSCADFGERIRDALKHSEWLIVVCSKTTKESVWVNNEIEVFLEYHDTSHILSVVTEGEPKDVFPNALIKCGMDESKLLAADARAKTLKQVIKKIRSDIKLKIAAPILHTTYDTLKQRNKIYAIKKAFALACISFITFSAFLGYAAIKSREIASQAVKLAKEHEEALKGQALYLTEQAKKSYESNEPLLAIDQACQAYDLLDTDHSLVPELIRFLTKVLGVYTLPLHTESSMTVTGYFPLDNCSTEDYFLDSDGKRLFTTDSSHNIYIWDTDTFQRIDTITTTENIRKFDKDLLISSKKQCLFTTINEIVCYDYIQKSVVWNYKFGEDFFVNLKVNEDESKIVVFTNRKLYIFDSAGTLLDSSVPPKISESELAVTELSHTELAISPDNNWIAFAIEREEKKDTLYRIETVIYDVAKRQYTLVSSFESMTTVPFSPYELHFTDGNKLFLLYGTGTNTIYMDTIYQYYSVPMNLTASVYDPEKKQNLWESSKNCMSVHGELIALDTIYKKQPAILLIYGTTCEILDQATGVILNSCETAAPVINAWCEKDYDILVLNNGDLVYHMHNEDHLTGYECFPDKIAACYRHDTDYYIIKRKVGAFHYEPSIFKYQQGAFSPGYERCLSVTAEDGENKMERKDGWRLPDSIEYPSSDTEANGQNGQYYAHIKNNSIAIENRKTKKERLLKTEKEPLSLLCIPDSDKLLISFADRISLYNMHTEAWVSSIEFEEGILSSYYSWQVINPSTVIYLPYSVDTEHYLPEDKDCYVLNISEKSFGIMYELKGLYAYDPEEDVFYFLSAKTSWDIFKGQIEPEKIEFGKIKRYSTEEIIKMAKNKIT